MKDGANPRQDSSFSGLHNEQQQMQFGQASAVNCIA